MAILPITSLSDEVLSSPDPEMVEWEQIRGKPSKFTPADHTHPIESIDGLQNALDSLKPNEVSIENIEGLQEKLTDLETPDWQNVDNKPDVFPPEDHKHSLIDIEGLTEALEEKRNAGDISAEEIKGLSESLQHLAEPEWGKVRGKPETFPPSKHGHSIEQVDGLGEALSALGAAPAWDDVTGKPTEYPPAGHKHTVADITELKALLDGIPKFELVESKVATAGTKVAIKFTKAYKAAPLVQPSPVWNGSQMVIGQASDITTTGCNVTVMQSRGTLLLTSGPFESAAVNAMFRMFVIGN